VGSLTSACVSARFASSSSDRPGCWDPALGLRRGIGPPGEETPTGTYLGRSACPRTGCAARHAGCSGEWSRGPDSGTEAILRVRCRRQPRERHAQTMALKRAGWVFLFVVSAAPLTTSRAQTNNLPGPQPGPNPGPGPTPGQPAPVKPLPPDFPPGQPGDPHGPGPSNTLPGSGGSSGRGMGGSGAPGARGSGGLTGTAGR